ncbi:MAG: tripartite tricarboxylate transporter permease [Candidatus Aenigmarchaeota archaeon]|nr:tripartite tricarboxylate transporter permease [Candidatus Aenigmarchaeota archaeon]
MLDVLLFLAIGIGLGVLAGIVPGLHPNMVILFVPIISSLGIMPLNLIVLIVAMGVSNSIVDAIPSIFLGAPDGDNALNAMPGHKMLLAGCGYDAVKLTVVGSLASAVLLLPLVPMLFYFIPPLFHAVQAYTHILVGAIAAYMILAEKSRAIGFFVFLAAGITGVLSLKLPVDTTIILFPMMSGFFGIGGLLIAGNASLPVQKNEASVSMASARSGIISGIAGGIASGFLPGVGASQIAALLSSSQDDHKFLAMMGAITTTNIMVSILALWLIERGRSGIAVAIGNFAEITVHEFMAMVFASLIAASIASVITLRIAKKFLEIFQNQQKLRISIIAFILLAVTGTSGAYGILVLFTCTALGFFAAKAGVRRGLLMGSLMVPVILFYAA